MNYQYGEQGGALRALLGFDMPAIKASAKVQEEIPVHRSPVRRARQPGPISEISIGTQVRQGVGLGYR